MLAQRDDIYKIKHLRSRRENTITQETLVPTDYKKKSHVSRLLIAGTQKREISKPEKRWSNQFRFSERLPLSSVRYKQDKSSYAYYFQWLLGFHLCRLLDIIQLKAFLWKLYSDYAWTCDVYVRKYRAVKCHGKSILKIRRSDIQFQHSTQASCPHVKVKESRNRPGVSQRVPRGLGSQISWLSAREDGEVVSLTQRLPFLPGMFLVLIFTRGWVDLRAMVRSEGICHWRIQWHHGESIRGRPTSSAAP